MKSRKSGKRIVTCFGTPASPRLRQGFTFSLFNLKRKWTMN